MTLSDKMTENIEDLCAWYNPAITQRETEIERGEGTHGTKGFEDMGCYECSGYNSSCRSYEKIISGDRK